MQNQNIFTFFHLLLTLNTNIANIFSGLWQRRKYANMLKFQKVSHRNECLVHRHAFLLEI